MFLAVVMLLSAVAAGGAAAPPAAATGSDAAPGGTSPTDSVAALDERGVSPVEQSDDDVQSLLEASESPECPTCGSMSLYYSEGCKTCESCGWSEC